MIDVCLRRLCPIVLDCRGSYDYAIVVFCINSPDDFWHEPHWPQLVFLGRVVWQCQLADETAVKSVDNRFVVSNRIILILHCSQSCTVVTTVMLQSFTLAYSYRSQSNNQCNHCVYVLEASSCSYIRTHWKVNVLWWHPVTTVWSLKSLTGGQNCVAVIILSPFSWVGISLWHFVSMASQFYGSCHHVAAGWVSVIRVILSVIIMC